MKRVNLGGSDVNVSEICLGTMTFGNSTDEAEAHVQMDRAVDAGLTFMDCAEMYPVPPRKETVGISEELIGRWFSQSGNRNRTEIATKITGPSQIVRDGKPFDGAILRQTIEASLKRLQTDYIDLYQLHWPVRGGWAFRQNWKYAPSGWSKQQVLDHMEDVLAAAAEAVTAGKIRAFGLSNETAWGVARWCDIADKTGGPRVASIQNEYSPLYRLFDTDLGETLHAEDVTLLSYSPLAAGLLTGKYQNDPMPKDSRAAFAQSVGERPDLGGRMTERGLVATAAFHDLSTAHGWDPINLAIAWQSTRSFKVIPIIGATTVSQLDHLIAGFGNPVPDDLCKAIDLFHKDHPLPY